MFLNEFEMDRNHNLNNDLELDSIYEEVLNYHINDYTIFEATLRRDFLEVNGILTEDGNKNFLKTIWEKILAFIKKAKDRIVEFFKNIRNKLFYNEKKLKEIRNKYMGYYSNEKAFNLLKDFTMNNFKAFDCSIKISDLVDLCYEGQYKLFERGHTGITDERLKEIENRANENIKENIHKKIWLDKKVTKPFSEIDGIFNYICDAITKNMDKLEEVLVSKEKNFKDLLKETEDITKEDLKEYEKYSKEYPGDYDTKIKEAQNRLKAISLLETLRIRETTILIEESKDLLVACVKLYIAGGKYLQKKLGKDSSNKKESTEESFIIDDIDYINAVTEAEIYELEL